MELILIKYVLSKKTKMMLENIIPMKEMRKKDSINPTFSEHWFRLAKWIILKGKFILEYFFKFF